MLKSYEAIYDHGQLLWLKDKPDTEQARVIVTIVEEPVKPRRSSQEIRQIFDEAWGAWGTGKTPDEIDREIEAMRADWERDWDLSK